MRSINYKPETFQPAVFLDRDGTINEERGYICTPEDIVLFPTACRAIRWLNALRVPVVIITNQSAIGRGLMTVAEFKAVTTAFREALHDSDAHYDALYYCPHVPDATHPCPCRKPQPGLLLRAATELNLDLSKSYMVGDKLTDLEAGHAAGCESVLVRTGFGEKTYRSLKDHHRQPAYIANTLLQAVEWIIDEIKNCRTKPELG
jgi:D-glycero-D-manno-heptose 1,7-bisphosphate phosphatase